MDSHIWEYIKYLVVAPILAIFGWIIKDKVKDMQTLENEVQQLRMKVVTLETQFTYINKNLEELKEMVNALLERKHLK
jgi:chaperonin cofactor prefoldin